MRRAPRTACAARERRAPPARSATRSRSACETGLARRGSGGGTCSSRFAGHAGLPDHTMEQLFEILIIHLQPTDDDAVMVRQHEERACRPAVRHGDAQLAPSIVVEHSDAFKA